MSRHSFDQQCGWATSPSLWATTSVSMTTAFIILMTGLASAQLPPSPEPATQEGLEVLNHGPVHGAFAEVYSDDPQPGMTAPRQPPEPIDELPPDHRLEGDDVVWIPGYWAWDQEREDFIWVSGIWRRVPPDRVWVPGTWTETEGRWQWSPGFWAAASASELELEYLPAPPQNLEVGPGTTAGEGQFYVPGCWQYTSGNYRWRPGYWSLAYDDWLWVPDRYVWTTRGCIFLPGYWDYALPYRGTLFAPVYCHPSYFTGYRYPYVPSYVINTGPSFFVHLFVNPSHGHYYFGNYYASHYRQSGIYPWVNIWTHHHHYDPLYAFHHHRAGGSTFVRGVRDWHGYFGRHEELRPGRSLSRQREHHLEGDVARMAALGTRFDEARRGGDRGRSFVRVGDEAREQFRRDGRTLREAGGRRAEFEAQARRGRGNGIDAARSTLRLPELDDRTRQLRASVAERSAAERRTRGAARPDGGGGRARRGVAAGAGVESSGGRLDAERRARPGAPRAEVLPGRRSADNGRDVRRDSLAPLRNDLEALGRRLTERAERPSSSARNSDARASTGTRLRVELDALRRRLQDSLPSTRSPAINRVEPGTSPRAQPGRQQARENTRGSTPRSAERTAGGERTRSAAADALRRTVDEAVRSRPQRDALRRRMQENLGLPLRSPTSGAARRTDASTDLRRPRPADTRLGTRPGDRTPSAARSSAASRAPVRAAEREPARRSRAGVESSPARPRTNPPAVRTPATSRAAPRTSARVESTRRQGEAAIRALRSPQRQQTVLRQPSRPRAAPQANRAAPQLRRAAPARVRAPARRPQPQPSARRAPSARSTARPGGARPNAMPRAGGGSSRSVNRARANR